MSARHSASEDRRRGIGGYPLGPAAVAGVALFLLGYLLTYLVKIGDVNEALETPLVDLSAVAPPAVWQVIGWFFYAGHNVQVTLSGTLGGSTTWTTLGLDVPTWLLLLPVGLLLVAGFATVRYAEIRRPGRGAMSGALVALPYLVCVVLLGILAGWTASPGGTASLRIAPHLITTVFVAGVGYPVVFGGVGGALAAVVAG